MIQIAAMMIAELKFLVSRNTSRQDIIGRIALGGDADELLAMIDEITF